MKLQNYLLLLGSAILITTACTKQGCTDPIATNYDEDAKKNDGSCIYDEDAIDTEPPTIELNGADTVYMSVGNSYTEEGAVATNQDGSEVDVTIDDSGLDTTEAGTYEVIYSATNDNGTSTATRVVIVEITAESLTGTYTVTSDCDGTQFPLNETPEIILGANENEILIDEAFNLVGGQIMGIVANDEVAIPFQTIDITLGDIEVDGGGLYNSLGTEITITYFYNNTAPIVGGQGTCTAVYSKD